MAKSPITHQRIGSETSSDVLFFFPSDVLKATLLTDGRAQAQKLATQLHDFPVL